MQHASGMCSPELIDSIRVICVIRGRKNSPALAGRNLADKVAFLWLNTELRGCRETAWATT